MVTVTQTEEGDFANAETKEEEIEMIRCDAIEGFYKPLPEHIDRIEAHRAANQFYCPDKNVEIYGDLDSNVRKTLQLNFEPCEKRRRTATSTYECPNEETRAVNLAGKRLFLLQNMEDIWQDEN